MCSSFSEFSIQLCADYNCHNYLILDNACHQFRIGDGSFVAVISNISQARFACLRCTAGGHFVSAGGALWVPGVTLINNKGNNISKYVCTVIVDIARKITKMNIFKNFL